jgi:hypothetical protein
LSAPRRLARSSIWGRAASASVLLLGFWAAACTDSPTETAKPGNGPELTARDPNAQTVTLICQASRSKLNVSCAGPQQAGAGKGGPVADIVYGGQNLFVTVTSSNVAYNSGTGRFTFDMTLKNLLQQPIGTTDGSTLAPTGVRVFFSAGPTVTGGSGVAAVLPDGFATFTAGGQSFYQYDQILSQNQTSAIKLWTIIIAPTVDTFTFLLLISAPVQYPGGYIEINGQLPGASFGSLHPGSATPLVGVVKNQLGVVIPGAVITWGTTDVNQATVDASGSVTGVRYGVPAITATSLGLNGSMLFNVTGTGRVWNGSASTDWENAANWTGGYTPAVVDTATVPAGVPNFPSLTIAEAIGGIDVADAATLNLGAFNLTLTSNALTGQASGGVLGTTGLLNLTGSGGLVSGRFSLVNVTGTYAQNGNVRVVAPITVPRGMLTIPGFLTSIVGQ